MNTNVNIDVPVLIAGAGPAGLVLALALVQNGIEVRIIDKEPFFRPGQRGAGIQPRTLEIFNYLGVLDDIRAKAIVVPNERRVYKLPGGTEPLKTVNMLQHDDPTPSTPISNGVHLAQESTEAILREHLKQYGCEVELGTELRKVEQHPDHVVVRLAKQEDDKETIVNVTCHWLVGTDGGRGATRKQLGLTFQGETRTQHTLSSEIEIFNLDRNYWHSWGDMATVYCMMRPTENPNCFYVALGGNIDHAKLESDRDAFFKAICDATDRQDLQFGQLRWISNWRPNIRMVNKFREGRGFVAGDAAHVHSPTGGQGLNSSVQDSFNLAWKLALVEKGWATPSLLDTYNEERFPVIAAMLQASTSLLNALERRADEAAWTRGSVLKMLGINYRWSSIVVDERKAKPAEPVDVYGGEGGGELRAGDRALDAPALEPVGGRNEEGRTLTLFGIFRPMYHTIMVFSSDTAYASPILEEVKRLPTGSLKVVVIFPRGTRSVAAVAGADYTVVDTEGHAYVAYGVLPEHPMTAIIRPDGVVGGIVFGLEGLRTYLQAVFSAI